MMEWGSDGVVKWREEKPRITRMSTDLKTEGGQRRLLLRPLGLRRDRKGANEELGIRNEELGKNGHDKL